MVGNLFEGDLDYVAGLYYFKENVKEDNPQSFLMPAVYAYGSQSAATRNFLCRGSCAGKDTVLGAPLFIYGGTAKSYAAFGQLDYHITDDFDALFGLRYTRDQKDVYLIKDRLNSNQPIDADDSWSRVNPSLSLKYQWTEALNTYFTAASGYRSGGFNARASSVTSFQTPFDEEQVISYELGWKSDWWDRRVRFNGALFYLDYDDRQVTQLVASSSGASSVVVNAGKSTAQGIELEATALIGEGFTVTANYGYTDITFKDFVTTLANPVTGFTIAENVDLSSDPRATTFEPVNAPENTASLALEYRFPATSWGEVAARLGATYSSSFVNQPILNLYDSTDSYTLLDGRISLSKIPVFGDSTLDVGLWGKNLANKKVRMVGVDFGSLGFASNSYLELAAYGIDLTMEL
jgi:iron complex outermembrane receptor protein